MGTHGQPAGRGIRTVLEGAFGSVAWVVPLLVALLAWRYLRHPDRNAETARAAIGWTALLLAVLGLVHLAKGTPRPSDGPAAMHGAGGLVGYAVSAYRQRRDALGGGAAAGRVREEAEGH